MCRICSESMFSRTRTKKCPQLVNQLLYNQILYSQPNVLLLLARPSFVSATFLLTLIQNVNLVIEVDNSFFKTFFSQKWCEKERAIKTSFLGEKKIPVYNFWKFFARRKNSSHSLSENFFNFYIFNFLSVAFYIVEIVEIVLSVSKYKTCFE